MAIPPNLGHGDLEEWCKVSRGRIPFKVFSTRVCS